MWVARRLFIVEGWELIRMMISLKISDKHNQWLISIT